MNQIDTPLIHYPIFVLFNAFEKLCFPHCITETSQVYFLNVRNSCKYIHFAVRSGRGMLEQRETAEQNNSAIIMNKIFVVGH